MNNEEVEETPSELELIAKGQTPIPNHNIGLFKRDHETTPYMVCGMKGEEPMIECGFWAYTHKPNVNHVLTKALNDVLVRTFG